MEDEIDDQVNLRWFETADPAPFRLARKYSSGTNALSSAVALFPWSLESLDTLWSGELNTPEHQPAWNTMVLEWASACALGYPGKVVVYGLQSPTKSICVKVPDSETGNSNIAWAIRHALPFEPLLIISASSLIYVLNVPRRQIVSYLRGHGGAITSIATHPTYPHIFCTTSRDFSTRIYDLLREPQQVPHNPHWPPGSSPSRAGAAHGMHMTESEGYHMGRCVAVLVGGRSGGHMGAVLGAAFHPNPVYPLIATCGVDRTVKIWRFPPLHDIALAREDKPLFSSSQIHKARVLSVTWLNDHILISHGAPAMMRRRPNDPDHMYKEPGTLVVWRWLGLDRFFPADRPAGQPHQQILRGCASDFQESASFKLICVNSLPMDLNNLHVYRSLSHEPIVLFPYENSIRMLNVTHLPPRFAVAPPPPPIVQDDDMADIMRRARINDDEENEEDNTPAPCPDVPVEWEISVSTGKRKGEDLLACTMGADGDLIVGVGAKGSVWMWKNTNP